MPNVYIVEAKRTPIARYQTDLKDIDAPFLGIPLLRSLLDQLGEDEGQINDLLVGHMGGSSSTYHHLARYMALEAGFSPEIRTQTISHGHTSGVMVATQAFERIKNQTSQMVVALATDSASCMPFQIAPEVSDIFLDLVREKGIKERLLTLTRLNLKKMAPVSTFKKALEDSFLHQKMTDIMEDLIIEMLIDREEQDSWSHQSHLKAFMAQKQNFFETEILPIACGMGLDRLLTKDLGPRGESNVQTLSSLKPFTRLNGFKNGTITIGNSAFLADGAACLFLASEEAVEKNNLQPLAKIVGYSIGNYHPKWGSVGGVISFSRLLENSHLSLDDLDAVEFHEDFAASVLIQKKILSDDFWSKRLNIKRPKGHLPDEKINPLGGAISLGHPFGASGMRMIVTLCHHLKRSGGKLGVVTMGGNLGEACSLLIENSGGQV